MSAGLTRFGIPWTAREDAVIRKHYETHTDRQIADMLPRRNAKAVNCRRRNLRLRKYGAERGPGVEIVRYAAEGVKPSETCPLTMTRAEMAEVSGMPPEAAMMAIMERRGYL